MNEINSIKNLLITTQIILDKRNIWNIIWIKKSSF
jgi:hypothetical protein